jgi:hypothetical protein
MRYVVVGAGVAGAAHLWSLWRTARAQPPRSKHGAGVCCTRELLRRLQPDDRLTLVAPGDAVKVRQPLLRACVRLFGLRCALDSGRARFACRRSQCVENVERVTRRVELFDGALALRRRRDVKTHATVLTCAPLAQWWLGRWSGCRPQT